MAQLGAENYLRVSRSPMVISMVHEEAVRNRNVFLDVQATPLREAYEPHHMGPMPGYPKAAFGTEKVMDDICYKNISPVLNLLRAMGVLPISRPRPGLTRFALASPAMLYSAVFFCALTVYVGYVGKMRFDIVKQMEGGFEEAMVGYLFLVNMLPLALVPVMWKETSKIAKVLNGWSDFELCYQKVSNKILPIDLHNRALTVAIMIPLMSTISVVVTHVTMVDFQVFQVIPYCFLDTLTYMLGAYWYLLCSVISAIAVEVADDFQLTLRHVGPAANIADYRGLWLRLSKMTRDTGTATCYTFTLMNLYLFLIITLSIYGLLSKINDGFGTKDIGLALTACCSVCLLFFICDQAHLASANVQTNFQKKLLMVELSWMNINAQTEVHQFLRATEMHPSNISLGGFFYVNRNLFKSILATMVTYLVVLLQFQISIPTEVVAPNDENMTMTSNI